MGALTVEFISDPRAIGPIEDRWRELAVMRSNAFVTPEWFRGWWEGWRKSSSTPLIAVARRQDESVAGVMPLVSDESSHPRAVRFAGASIGDRFHPAASVSEESAVARATMAALEKAGFERRMLQFEHTDSDSDWWKEMRLAATNKRLIVEQQQTAVSHIELDDLDWETYLSQRSRTFRKQVRRSERALVRDHAMEVRFSTSETFEADLVELFRLHDLRRASLGGSSLHAAARRALFAFAAAAQQRGWLRLAVMEADGRPVAAFLGWRLGGTVASYQGGFDPAWSKAGVGFALEATMVRSAIDEGATDYDFLLGTERWKQRFTSAARLSQTVIVVPAGGPVHLVVAAEARVRRIGAGLRRTPRLNRLVRSLHPVIPTVRRS